MDPKRLKGEAVLADKLKPDLAGNAVKLVKDDMDRAKKAADERQKRKKGDTKR